MQILLALGILFYFPSFSYAKTCSTSARSCDFYSCMEQKSHCGNHGYWKELGLHYCQKFLFRENKFSEPAQAWLRASRLCLQRRSRGLAPPMTCSHMMSAALGIHVGCYVDTGFCDLSRQDKNKIYSYLFTALAYPQVLQAALKVGRLCRQYGSSSLIE